MPHPRARSPAGSAESSSSSLAHRLAWFVGLWAAGVVTVGAVGYLIKLMIAI
jgi:hypothetical protein